MKLSLLVKPNSKHEKVEDLGDGTWKVSVKAPPTEGKANEAVIAALAKHFGVPKSAVILLHGLKGKRKRVMVDK